MYIPTGNAFGTDNSTNIGITKMLQPSYIDKIDLTVHSASKIGWVIQTKFQVLQLLLPLPMWDCYQHIVGHP